MTGNIKVGICVAYDWELLEISIPLIYDHADSILLAIDRNRTSWSGIKYKLEDVPFFEMIKKIDRYSKIQVWEEDFYSPCKTAMQNEINQRTKMAEKMGEGGWFIQLDCDEYFLNFGGFTEALKSKKRYGRAGVNICCPFIILFKKIDSAYLTVSLQSASKFEYVPVATAHPLYEFGRRNGYFNYHSSFFVLHQSWARAPEDVKEKLENWGHFGDFDAESFYKLWNSAEESNYMEYRDFHPIVPENWPALDRIPVKNIQALIQYYTEFPPRIGKMRLFIKNSRILSGIISKLRRLWKSR